jgi:tRNA G46 methylase TrmB
VKAELEQKRSVLLFVQGLDTGRLAQGEAVKAGAVQLAEDFRLLDAVEVVRHVCPEDGRDYELAGLPPLSMLHVYHPDPWPKAKHHKNRFFRSPDAKAWARALVPGAELRVSTDHAEYFEEIVDILNSWTDLGEIECVYSKTSSAGHANTHFEALFLGKGQPVYKLIFRRAPL